MNAKQLQVWKVLEEYSDLPDVLHTLLLKFVVSYGWDNLNRIPYGVTCACVLNMNINVSMLVIPRVPRVLGNIKKAMLLNCKVGVIRTKGINVDEFTLKFRFGGIQRTLTPGVTYHIIPNSLWFLTGRYCGVTIRKL